MVPMEATKGSLTASRVRALNAVIDEGSYAAAARRLGASQPAVSQAIRELEKAFKVNLFERRGRKLVATDLCLELAPITDEIGRLEDKAVHLMQRGERLSTGVLRIGIGSLMPGMALIGAFQQRFPGVQVQVEYAMYTEIIDAVLERRADIGILPDVPKDGRFKKKLCLTQDVVALVPVGHALAASSRISLAELVGERLIFQQKGSVTQKLLDAAFRKVGLTPRASLMLKTHGEVYEAVVAGLGIGFIWRYATTRKDGARRIPIAEVGTVYEEDIFCLAGTTDPIIDMFFSVADRIKFQ